MAAAYVVTNYASSAAADVAIAAATADKLVAVVAFQEGSKWIFKVIVKA